MELNFDVYVSVNDSNNYDKKCFVIDYEPTLKDYNDFAKDEGFKDILNMFESNLIGEDEDSELEFVKQALSEHKYYRLEMEMGYIDYDKAFTKFLTNKYYDQFVKQLPYCLVLSDMAHFEFDDK